MNSFILPYLRMLQGSYLPASECSQKEQSASPNKTQIRGKSDFPMSRLDVFGFCPALPFPIFCIVIIIIITITDHQIRPDFAGRQSFFIDALESNITHTLPLITLQQPNTQFTCTLAGLLWPACLKRTSNATAPSLDKLRTTTCWTSQVYCHL